MADETKYIFGISAEEVKKGDAVIHVDPAKAGSDETVFQIVYNPWNFEVLTPLAVLPWNKEVERIHEEIKESCALPKETFHIEVRSVSAASAESVRQASLNMLGCMTELIHQQIFGAILRPIEQVPKKKPALRGTKEGETEIEPGIYLSEK